MTNQDCGICRGAGVIRLPYSPPPIIAPYKPLDEPTLESGYREYPCPECGIMVERQRIMTVARQEPIQQRYIDQVLPHIKRTIATNLGQYMVERDMIYFDRSAEPDLQTGDWTIRGTLGVVQPESFRLIENQIVDRQYEVAWAVINEAVRLIDSWGRDFKYQSVPKDVAKDDLNQAMTHIRKQYDGRVAVEALASIGK